MSVESGHKPVMQMWVLAIRSRYAKAEVWSNYADDILAAMDSAPLWVIELACYSDTETVLAKLEKILEAADLPLDFCEQREVYMGYRFKLLAEGKISVEDFCQDDWTQLEIDYAFYEHFPESG